ncbi:MAG TPA: peptidoglycan-associated lipoprotein Pal [Candidatus Limnocylindria bacterium]|nr:peptidoglycan-associated lipoprotein Pal [Candidatus Limnocylindria bacterium]
MRRARTGAVVIICVVALLGSWGCKKKGPSPLDGDLAGERGGLDEGGLAGRGSMARVQRGELPEEDGILKDVRFSYDSAELDEEAQRIASQNAAWLRANPTAKVEIEGHCDERGTIEYNLGLGSRRAKAAKDYLVTAGVDSSRISTISYGKELPLCHEQNESCYARNRRVHFVVLGQ